MINKAVFDKSPPSVAIEVDPGFIALGFSEEGVSYFALALAMFVVPDSSTHDAAHSEKDSVATQTQGDSDGVHVGEHASAHNIVNPLEVLSD